MTGGEGDGEVTGEGVTDRQPGQEGAGAEENAGKTQDSTGKFRHTSKSQSNGMHGGALGGWVEGGESAQLRVCVCERGVNGGKQLTPSKMGRVLKIQCTIYKSFSRKTAAAQPEAFCQPGPLVFYYNTQTHVYVKLVVFFFSLCLSLWQGLRHPIKIQKPPQ